MTDQAKTAEEGQEEIPKLTQAEEEQLKTAATRGSFVKEFELQGRIYAIGTASGAADRHWNMQKVAARIRARKDIVDMIRAESGLKETDTFPFFVSEEDVRIAAIPDSNTAYAASHLRTVDGTAVDYDGAKAAVEGMEGVIKQILIDEIESMYESYKGLLVKLRHGANAKKSQALAKSSTNS